MTTTEPRDTTILNRDPRDGDEPIRRDTDDRTNGHDTAGRTRILDSEPVLPRQTEKVQSSGSIGLFAASLIVLLLAAVCGLGYFTYVHDQQITAIDVDTSEGISAAKAKAAGVADELATFKTDVEKQAGRNARAFKMLDERLVVAEDRLAVHASSLADLEYKAAAAIAAREAQGALLVRTAARLEESVTGETLGDIEARVRAQLDAASQPPARE